MSFDPPIDVVCTSKVPRSRPNLEGSKLQNHVDFGASHLMRGRYPKDPPPSDKPTTPCLSELRGRDRGDTVKFTGHAAYVVSFALLTDIQRRSIQKPYDSSRQTCSLRQPLAASAGRPFEHSKSPEFSMSRPLRRTTSQCLPLSRPTA